MAIPKRPQGRGPIPSVQTATGHGHGRIKLKQVVAISAAKWAWERRATRLTPPIMAVTFFAGTPLAMAWGRWWWVTLIVGIVVSAVVWLTQRQVTDKSVDDDIAEQQASQWAARTAVVPIAATLYLQVVHVVHVTAEPVRVPLLGPHRLAPLWPPENLIVLGLAYFVGCAALWAFMFTASAVTSTRLQAQVKKTWLFRTVGTALEGTRIVRRKRNRHGEEIELDARDVGVLPSQLLGPQARESIAVKHGVAIERVQIRPKKGNAGRIVVQLTHTSPWGGEIRHPLHPTYALDTPGDRSIRQPVVLGVDPLDTNEAKRVITKTLYTGSGVQHVLVVAGTGGGKTALMNNIVEHLTDCSDAALVMIDVTKAIDAEAWRWACLRVHCGPDAAQGAVTELEMAKKLIDARSEARRSAAKKTAVFAPTKTNPALYVILDEADQVLTGKGPLVARAQAAAKYILSKGRSEGVGIIIAAQRGTLDYLGKGDVKANSYTRIVLGVSQTSEMQWALPGWDNRGVPDMSTYGEGAPGVFVLSEPRSFRTGRSFALYDTELLAGIAMDRCRPEHLDDLIRHMHRLAGEGEPIPVLAGGRWSQALACGVLPPLPVEQVTVTTPAIQRVTVSTPTNGAPAGTGVGLVNGSLLAAYRPIPDLSLLTEPPADGTDDPDPDLTATVAGLQNRARSTVAHTSALAEAAHTRGPVSMADLIAAKVAEQTDDLPIEVRRYALTLADHAGIRGFTRADLEAGIASLPAVPDRSARWVQGALRQMVRDGDLEQVGGGRSIRYRRVRTTQ